jgi:hypothetical protein
MISPIKIITFCPGFFGYGTINTLDSSFGSFGNTL